ncbi:MAG: tetraacyldisaccharide 4'-kinase [Deltaproteobacteria bacterium]|nr:tetraacyldisaccharide 4'-kinase [Deltaproteobacteria bacterium]
MRIETHRAIRRIWAGGGGWGEMLSLGLFPFSWSYGLAVALRNRFYDRGICRRERLPIPVISVGNITAGGTGKTPLVIHLARLLKRNGYRPAVASRGYGGDAPGPVHIVSDGQRILMGYRQAGDEPVLIAGTVAGVPVLTGPRRVIAGRLAIDRFGADVLILDDGFQHRHLIRDIDIVTIDARRPFGNGRLLPAGPLREPAAALRRAHAILGTGGTDAAVDEEWMISPPDAQHDPRDGKAGLPAIPKFRAFSRPVDLFGPSTGEAQPLEALKGRRICAFAGIGEPDNFRETLDALKAEIVAFTAFPDHYRYGRKDMDRIEETAAAGRAEAIVTTEKDLVRLENLPVFPEKLWALRAEMAVLDADVPFEQWILHRLSGLGDRMSADTGSPGGGISRLHTGKAHG